MSGILRLLLSFLEETKFKFPTKSTSFGEINQLFDFKFYFQEPL